MGDLILGTDFKAKAEKERGEHIAERLEEIDHSKVLAGNALFHHLATFVAPDKDPA